MLIHFNYIALLLVLWFISNGRLSEPSSLQLFLCKQNVPDNKVVRVNLVSTAAVQQDPRVSYNGTVSVMLVLHGGCGGQKTVEIFWNVCCAVAIKNIVDDISWFQCALQNRYVSLWIKKSQNVLPVKKYNTNLNQLWKTLLGWVWPCWDNCGEWRVCLMRLERVLLNVQLFDESLAVLLQLGFISLLNLVKAVGSTCATAFLNGNGKSCYWHNKNFVI